MELLILGSSIILTALISLFVFGREKEMPFKPAM